MHLRCLALPLSLLLLFLAPPAGADDPPPRPGEVRVYLRDGRNVVGVVVERGDDGYLLETPAGERVQVPADQIREVIHLGPEVAPPAAPDLDPTRSRYFTAPSALPLPGGTFLLSLAQPAIGTVSYAPFDFLTVTAGGTAPASYLDGYTGALARVQGNWSPLSWLHGAAGVEAQVWSGRQIGFLYGQVTVGTPSLHATVHAGASPIGSSRQGFGDTALALAGLARVRPGVALVTEHWLRLDGGSGAFDALGVRFYSTRLSADLGAVRLARGGFMPWIGVGFAPGARRDLGL